MRRLAIRVLVAGAAAAGLSVVVVPATPSSATLALAVPTSVMVTEASPDTGCVLPLSPNHPDAQITTTYTLSAPHGTAILSEFSDFQCSETINVVTVTDRTVHGTVTLPQGVFYRINVSQQARAVVRFS